MKIDSKSLPIYIILENEAEKVYLNQIYEDFKRLGFKVRYNGVKGFVLSLNDEI